MAASPLAKFGSFSVEDAWVKSIIHLCQCRDFSERAYGDIVRAIDATALVWPHDWPTPSELLPGVVVLYVDYDVVERGGWDAAVDGLKEAESDSHRSVAVVGTLDDSIKPLSDYAASHRDAAATNIWVMDGDPYYLSDWQQELSVAQRYHRLPASPTPVAAIPLRYLAEFGSFRVKDSAVNYTIHLRQCRDDWNAAFEDKARAVRAAALVWPIKGRKKPSWLPGVVVLYVDYDVVERGGWDAAVDGLQEAERDGRRSVAVVGHWGDIKWLSDHAASCRPTAATDIWVMHWFTDYLSKWQRQLSDDARYQRLM